MSDFEAAEEMPLEAVQAMRKHPAFKGLFEGEDFSGKFLYHERITEDNGDVWHLAVVETEEGITQFGVDAAKVEIQFLQPISISELRFYCNLSPEFRTALLTLADEIADEVDLHDHGHHHHH